MPVQAVDPIIRFKKKVRRTKGCWEWTGTLKQDGTYGLFWDGTKTVLAHRWFYERINGPIPPNLTIDHLCRNKKCVRPTHLEPVTMQENKKRWAVLVTHCPAGHKYTKANTGWRKPTATRAPSRYCRACLRERSRLRRAG